MLCIWSWETVFFSCIHHSYLSQASFWVDTDRLSLTGSPWLHPLLRDRSHRKKCWPSPLALVSHWRCCACRRPCSHKSTLPDPTCVSVNVGFLPFWLMFVYMCVHTTCRCCDPPWVSADKDAGNRPQVPWKNKKHPYPLRSLSFPLSPALL